MSGWVSQASVHRPELVILDELATVLDPIGRRHVLEIMRRLRRTTTIFYSTHTLDDVEWISDTVAVLRAGQRVAQTPIEQLFGGSGAASFVVEVRGDGQTAAAQLEALPWVLAVESTAPGRRPLAGHHRAGAVAGRAPAAVRREQAAVEPHPQPGRPWGAGLGDRSARFEDQAGDYGDARIHVLDTGHIGAALDRPALRRHVLQGLDRLQGSAV